jgi:hypothetical protein
MDARDALQNCLQFSMNTTVNSTPDERDFLRVWRRRWRDLTAAYSERLFAHLNTTDLSGGEFFNTLHRIPPCSEWFRTHVRGTDLSGVHACLSEQFGTAVESLRLSLNLALNRYISVLQELFTVEGRLEEKLARCATLEAQLGALDLATVDPAVASTFQTALEVYAGAVFASAEIQADYDKFSVLYAEWILLRGLVLGPHVASSATTEGVGATGISCSICMEGKITATLIPCGHSFCNNCTQRQRHLCYVCRTPVERRMRLYFV